MAERESGRVTVERDVVFGTGGGRELRCNLYRPPGTDVAAPGVVLVHGGAWRTGDRNQLHGYGILLGRAGYVCVAPEYRLVDEAPWPAQIHDVKAAIRWMRANADQLGVDPQRIAIEGNSAGGHLALLAAGTAEVAELEGEGGHPGVATGVSAVLAVYPPTWLWHDRAEPHGTPFLAITDQGSTEGASLASPLTHVSPSFPPTLLIHGTSDVIVPALASVRMYEALLAAGVPAELHMYAEQPHAFDAQPAFGRQCAAEMLLFLDRYVRTSPEARAATDAALMVAQARQATAEAAAFSPG